MYKVYKEMYKVIQLYKVIQCSIAHCITCKYSGEGWGIFIQFFEKEIVKCT